MVLVFYQIMKNGHNALDLISCPPRVLPFDPMRLPNYYTILRLSWVYQLSLRLFQYSSKIGQNLKNDDRMALAENIFKRNSKTAKQTLEMMGFSVSESGIKLEKYEEWWIHINFYKHFKDKMIKCQIPQSMMQFDS